MLKKNPENGILESPVINTCGPMRLLHFSFYLENKLFTKTSIPLSIKSGEEGQGRAYIDHVSQNLQKKPCDNSRLVDALPDA